MHNSCHSFSLDADLGKAEEEKQEKVEEEEEEEEELHYASVTIVKLDHGKVKVQFTL